MKRTRALFIAIALFLAMPSISFAATQTFTSNGTFTVPAGVTSVTLDISGGGGGGQNSMAMEWDCSVPLAKNGEDTFFGTLLIAHGGLGTHCYAKAWPEASTDFRTPIGNYINLLGGAAGGPGGSSGGAGTYSSCGIGGSGGSSLFGAGGAGVSPGGNPNCMFSNGNNATGYGAGGGGSGASGGGGGAEAYQNKVVSVTPGQVILVTVGAGGLGSKMFTSFGAGEGGNGTPGFVQVTYTSTPPVPATGTVNVSSNISSAWTITGPATITGSGTSQSYPTQLAGAYTITWNSVAGYTTPASQTLTLAPGGAISFSGIYSVVGASAPAPVCTYSCPPGSTMSGSGATATCQAPAYQPAGIAATNTATSKTFTSNGTFTVPAGVTSVTLDISGGGGGGINYAIIDAGCTIGYYPIAVSGGNTSFGSLITTHGGGGAPCSNASGGAAGGPGGNPGGSWTGSVTYTSAGTGGDGGSSLFGTGGVGVLDPYAWNTSNGLWGYGLTFPNGNNGTGYGAGGGGSGIGNGGGGAEAYQNRTVSVTPGQVIPVTIGVGGHGSSLYMTTFGEGGSGSPGFVQVTYTSSTASASAPTPAISSCVPPAPAPTQVPTTPSSAPTATLTVSPNPASYGTRSTITWSSTNATNCTAGGAWSNSGTLAGSGLTDPLTAPASFTFQCTGPGGTSPVQSVTVGVNAPVVCATGLAYDAATHSCVSCSNGGCTGAGGTPTVPVGGLTCNNGTTNPPTCTQASPAPAAAPANPAQPAAPAAPTPPAAPAVFPCSIWGTTVFDGDSVTAFQFIAVKSPKTCASISELRKCTGGTLSGSFVNQNCKVMPTYNAF